MSTHSNAFILIIFLDLRIVTLTPPSCEEFLTIILHAKNICDCFDHCLTHNNIFQEIQKYKRPFPCG